jgi:hypothetical protein
MLNRRVVLVAALVALSCAMVSGVRAEDECDTLATTDNGQYTIELLSVTADDDNPELVTFEYEVCNTSDIGGGDNPSLSHWVLGLDLECLAEGFNLGDLVVEATFEGELLPEEDVEIGLDPTTGVSGVKFNNGHGDELGCFTYTVTFDTSVLQEGYTLCVGVVEVATKAGGQNGYASVCGPVCCEITLDECQEETAWGGETAGGGAAWWFYYDASVGGEQTIWAGQTINVGTVEVTDGVVSIVLTGGWELQDDDEAVKIQGYNDTVPRARPNPGSFDYKGTDLIVDIGEFDYYAIHLDVQLCD